MEWECFWVNLREDNKVSESKMAVSESNMAEFKMAAIIKLSQNEWMKFSCVNVGNYSWQVWVSLRGKTKMVESKMAKFKMAVLKVAAIINLSENEWVKFFCAKWLNPWWQRSRWLPSSSWGRMNEWRFFLYKMTETRMAEFKIAAIIKWSQYEWVKVFLMQIVGTNLGKCEWVWEGKLRWLNANWQNSRWLPSSS